MKKDTQKDEEKYELSSLSKVLLVIIFLFSIIVESLLAIAILLIRGFGV